MNGVGSAQTVHLQLIEMERSGLTHHKLEKRMTQDLTLSVTGDYRGDFWMTLDGTGAVTSDSGYDTARHELRYASAASGDGVEVLHPEWPTHLPEVWTNYLGYKAAASSVRALLAEMDPKTPVEETVYLGRPAWRATLLSSFPGAPGTIVTVDRATGLLLETRKSGKDQDGKPWLDVLRVTQFETNPQLKSGWQAVPLLKSPGKSLKWNYIYDNGTRFGSVGAVADRAWPTLPLIPTWTPEGYSRAALANAVYEDSRQGHDEDNSWHWGSDIVRRPGRLPGLAITKRLALKRCAQGVLIMYRRGFDNFTIEITPRKPDDPGMGKLDQGENMTMQDTVLTGGYLKGSRARTWLSSAMLPVEHVWGDSMEVPYQGPTLLTYSDRSQVVIYGDLTRQELIEVADSLSVYGDVNRPLPAGYGD